MENKGNLCDFLSCNKEWKKELDDNNYFHNYSRQFLKLELEA